jgi:hypothetical protein
MKGVFFVAGVYENISTSNTFSPPERSKPCDPIAHPPIFRALALYFL